LDIHIENGGEDAYRGNNARYFYFNESLER
jgi:hypothetical protein